MVLFSSYLGNGLSSLKERPKSNPRVNQNKTRMSNYGLKLCTQGCKWSQKKKKGNPRQDNEIWKLCNPHFSILLFVLTTNTFDCWLYYLPTILAFYKSGWHWQCLLGAGRDLFLTTLAKGSRAVSESECTWLSIIISQMLWLLMHCLVFRYSRKFGLRWILWIMHPFGSSLHVIQHNSQETRREI